MARNAGKALVPYLDAIFEEGTLVGLTDGQLLERFATRRGESAELAFEVLVERHGAMVLRACRGILRDEHEAMDAFQATFLVLVRKGRSLWVRDSLGPWLHRVACRAAIRARASAIRRRTLEQGLAGLAPASTGGEDRDDLASAVHEEVDRLPDRYRSPILLCDLGGRTLEEAARHLGCPIGTVSSRLARGRGRLRSRLARRGLGPVASGVIASILAGSRASAMPAMLASRTARLGLSFSEIGVGISPAGPAKLAGEIIRSAQMFKLSLIGLAIGVAVSAGVAAVGPLVGGQDPPAKPQAAKSKVADLKSLYPFMNDKDRLKDFVQCTIGNMRPLIEDELGVRCQSREAIIYKDGTAKLFTMDRKDPIAPVMAHKTPIRELDFFAEASLLITRSDDSIKLWDALTGEPRKELEGQTIRPMWLSTTPNGKFLATIDSTRKVVTV